MKEVLFSKWLLTEERSWSGFPPTEIGRYGSILHRRLFSLSILAENYSGFWHLPKERILAKRRMLA